MTDSSPTRSQTRHRPPSDRSAALPLTDAAAALGISENALRLRIRRQQVNAHKQDGRWYVVIDQVTDQSVDQSPDESKTSPDQSVTTPVDQSETVAALRETVEILQADVAFLRDQLDQRSRELAAERERSDVIQQLALGRIPQLAPGEAERTRPEPQEASGSGPGEEIAPKRTPDTSQSETGTPARQWWKFWKG